MNLLSVKEKHVTGMLIDSYETHGFFYCIIVIVNHQNWQIVYLSSKLIGRNPGEDNHSLEDSILQNNVHISTEILKKVVYIVHLFFGVLETILYYSLFYYHIFSLTYVSALVNTKHTSIQIFIQ